MVSQLKLVFSIFVLVVFTISSASALTISADGRPEIIDSANCNSNNWQNCNPFSTCLSWVQGANPFANFPNGAIPNTNFAFSNPFRGSTSAPPYGYNLLMTWPPYDNQLEVSGLTYVGRIQSTVLTGVPFVIGRLTHNNFPIDSRTQICNLISLDVPVRVTVNGEASNILKIRTNLKVEETPNDACSALYNTQAASTLWSPNKTNGETCACPFGDTCYGACMTLNGCSCGAGCRDRVSFQDSNARGDVEFTIGSNTYTLTLLGFNKQSSASAASSLTPANEFITNEGQTTSAFIWAQLDLQCVTSNDCSPNNACDQTSCVSSSCVHTPSPDLCNDYSAACQAAINNNPDIVVCEQPVCDSISGCTYPSSACPSVPPEACAGYECVLTGGTGADANCRQCVAVPRSNCPCINGCCGTCSTEPDSFGECVYNCPTTTPCVGCTTTTTLCNDPCGLGCDQTDCLCSNCVDPGSDPNCDCCQTVPNTQSICVWKGQGQNYQLVQVPNENVASYFDTPQERDPKTGNFFAGQTHWDDSQGGNPGDRTDCKFNCDCTCQVPTTTTTPLPPGIVPLVGCVKCAGDDCFAEMGYDASNVAPDPLSDDESYVTRSFKVITNNIMLCSDGDCIGTIYYSGEKGNPEHFFRKRIPVAFTMRFQRGQVIQWILDGQSVTVESTFGRLPVCPSTCEFPALITATASDKNKLLTVKYVLDLSPFKSSSGICPPTIQPLATGFAIDIPLCTPSLSIDIQPSKCLADPGSFFFDTSLTTLNNLGDAATCLNTSVLSPDGMIRPYIISFRGDQLDSCGYITITFQIDSSSCSSLRIGPNGKFSSLWSNPCAESCDNCRGLSILGFESACPSDKSSQCLADGLEFNPTTCDCSPPCPEVTCEPGQIMDGDCNCRDIDVCVGESCVSTTPPSCPPELCPTGPDQCGVCCGDNTACAGCDGTVGSARYVDHCGVPCGKGDTCPGCVGDTCLVCTQAVDKCGVCGGNDTTCYGCDHVPASGKQYDACGVCDGNGTSCLGCGGIPFAGPCPTGVTPAQAAAISSLAALAGLSALAVAAILFRLRKRPEILYQAWDDAINDYISDIIESPIYNGEVGGVNPLHGMM